jgi:arylsulfatase A-like enzyme
MEHKDEKASRRAFLKAGVGMVSAVGISSAPFKAVGPPRPDPPRPNFVFLLGEGHRPDALSLNGNTIVYTPNFDRIGREGIQFPNSFTVNALCLPARSVALTGLYTHSTGCVDNKGRVLPQEVPLFTELLRKAGYEVALFGKAHLGKLGERGWDYYFGFPGGATDYFWPVIDEGSDAKVKPPQAYEGYVDDLVTDRAVGWLKQKRDKPFCLCLWFQAPHAPFFRPRRYLDLYNGLLIPKPSTFDEDLKGYPGKPRAFADADNKIGGPYAKHSATASNCARSLEEIVKDYYVGVVDTDDNVGKVFQALSGLGQLEDTVMLFTSDHGFFLGEWRMYDKRLMHEPSIRTPMLIRYPRMIRPGSTRKEMILNTDLAPTFLELAGVTVPEWMQGQSLVPLLRGQEPKSWRKDWLYEYYEYPGTHNVRKNRGVRTDRYKLIHYYEAPEEFELYDLQEDPGELHNLYGDPRHATLAKQLRERIDQLRKESDDNYIYQEPSLPAHVGPQDRQ